MTTDPKINTIGDLLKISQNSPLELIIQALVNQDFAPVVEDMDGQFEAPLGTLSQVEKAIVTARSALADKGNHLINSVNMIYSEIHGQPGNELGKEKIDKLSREISHIKELCEILSSMLWNSVHQRFASKGIIHTGSLSVRSDYSIVPMSEKDDDENGFPVGLGLLGALFGGDMDFGPEMHDCANCSGYDECNLPIKKSR